MTRKLKIIFSSILVFVLVGSIQGVTFGQDKTFRFCLKVLDRYGNPVPNAKIKIVAVSERGKPYGPSYEWCWDRISDIDGAAMGGFGDLPEKKPGYLVISAEHQSINNAKKHIEWDEVLWDHPPLKGSDNSCIVLAAKGGPGIVAWRKIAAKRAPNLVEKLLKVTNKKEIEAAELELIRGEMNSIPALVKALRDYTHPHRKRLVNAFYKTFNGCHVYLYHVLSNEGGFLDEEVKKEALPIWWISSYRNAYRDKPYASSPTHILNLGKECIDELKWHIGDIKIDLKNAEQSGDQYSTSKNKELLKKFEEILKQIENKN